MPMHPSLPDVRESTVRETPQARPRIFLTFAGVDLALARPVAVQLRSAEGGFSLDYAVPSEPFAAQRSDLIRASLALRLKRCAATVCLYGAGTLDDDWVRWTLVAARQLRHPLLGVPFTGEGPTAVADRLTSLGAEIVPLRADAIAQRLALRPALPQSEPLTADVLVGTLRMMRHPLR
jgi:hypothetical protein